MISVIIPTHNRLDLLQEALHCVQTQSSPVKEIIVVNNGKRPLDVNVLPKGIKVVEAVQNAGASQARNIGASYATGEYLAFLDDDDLWTQNYIKNAKLYITQHTPMFILGQLNHRIDKKLKLFKSAQGKLFKDVIAISNPGVTGSNIIIQKELFNTLGGFRVDFTVSEDKAFLLDALNSHIRVHVVSNLSVIVRVQNVSLSNSMTNTNWPFLRAYWHIMSPLQRLHVLLRGRALKAAAKTKLSPSFLVWRLVDKYLNSKLHSKY